MKRLKSKTRVKGQVNVQVKDMLSFKSSCSHQHVHNLSHFRTLCRWLREADTELQYLFLAILSNVSAGSQSAKSVLTTPHTSTHLHHYTPSPDPRAMENISGIKNCVGPSNVCVGRRIGVTIYKSSACMLVCRQM
jgi:hypothetical protein